MESIPYEQLEISVIRPSAEKAVLTLRGEVDILTSPRLKEALIQLEEKEVRHIALDLRDLQYLDSSGIGVLVGALKRLSPPLGSLALISPKPSVLRVLTISKMDKILPIFDTVHEAFHAFAGN